MYFSCILFLLDHFCFGYMYSGTPPKDHLKIATTSEIQPLFQSPENLALYDMKFVAHSSQPFRPVNHGVP